MTALEQVFSVQNALAERLLARLPQAASDARTDEISFNPEVQTKAAASKRAFRPAQRAAAAEDFPLWEDAAPGFSPGMLPAAAVSRIIPETLGFPETAETAAGVISTASETPAATAAALSRAFERDARRYE